VNIKLDENLSRHLKERLLPLGHDVSTAFEEGLLGKPDVDVAAAAKGEERIVFTLEEPGSGITTTTIFNNCENVWGQP